MLERFSEASFFLGGLWTIAERKTYIKLDNEHQRVLVCSIFLAFDLFSYPASVPESASADQRLEHQWTTIDNRSMKAETRV